jgi:hypothetical protein
MIAIQATRAAAKTMTDPLDAMWARWNHVQSCPFPWMREEVEPMTELLVRLIAILDVTGIKAFVPEPPRGAGRPPEDRRGLARAFVAKAALGLATTSALTLAPTNRCAASVVGNDVHRFLPRPRFPAPLRSALKASTPTGCMRR